MLLQDKYIKATHFPMPLNNTDMFPSELVERLVRPMQEHSGPRALFRIAWSNACGAISITTAFFGTWARAS